jgi:cytochrome c biogenesis protein CcmG/thiol:disulfide interchange protein DsbE
MAVSNQPHAAAVPRTQASSPAHGLRLRLLYVVPAAAFLGISIAFGISLHRNPELIPSALIGKPVPKFSLAPVKGHALGLSTADLEGHVSLVNVFASWCVACREEHPLLMRLKAAGALPVYGIDYKDKPDDAARWLKTMGDPYARIGADLDGRVAIDWGVYGVPETYVIDRRGRIAYKQIGPISEKVLAKTILPLAAKLRNEKAGDTPLAADGRD